MIETWSINVNITGVSHDIAEFTSKKDAIDIAKKYGLLNNDTCKIIKQVVFESKEDYYNFFKEELE